MTRHLAVCLVLMLNAVSSFAVEFTLQGINGEKLIQRKLKRVDLTKSVGQITLETLAKKYGEGSSAFEADAASVTEIEGLRTHTQKFTNGSKRAFGWCYLVNGQGPDQMADETRLTSKTDSILWYYGSMSYSPVTGWESSCRPVLSYGAY